MAMGRRRRRQRQKPLWVATADLPNTAAHPFYRRLNELLDEHGFDAFAERCCEKFYAAEMGRPSLAPGIYFRSLLIGYFEGLDSERLIAWRLADSISLRRFVAIELDETTPDHSTISRTRRLIDVETHREVFTWVLEVIAQEGMLKGGTIAVDATTLEANAALRSIVRRDTGERYEEFLKRLAVESGIETPTKEQLAELDKKRKNKGSNDDWTHPYDPNAKIGKMKDGRTHLAHKAEQAVDLETGTVLAVTLEGAGAGDTVTLAQTVMEAVEQLATVATNQRANQRLAAGGLQELVADKGYHSNEVLADLAALKIRTYISEPDRGRRRWRNKAAAREAVYGNRRRIRGERGKRLLRQRGERVERSFAHLYETGGMRRTHLRGHPNILKRLLIHVGAFNLSLVLRKKLGAGTPRGLAALKKALQNALKSCLEVLKAVLTRCREQQHRDREPIPSPEFCHPIRFAA
jgi:transposase